MVIRGVIYSVGQMKQRVRRVSPRCFFFLEPVTVPGIPWMILIHKHRGVNNSERRRFLLSPCRRKNRSECNQQRKKHLYFLYFLSVLIAIVTWINLLLLRRTFGYLSLGINEIYVSICIYIFYVEINIYSVWPSN